MTRPLLPVVPGPITDNTSSFTLSSSKVSGPVLKSGEQSMASREAMRYFRDLLRDIRTMLAHARDQGLQIDDALRTDIIALFGAEEGTQEAPPLLTPSIPSGASAE